MNVAKMEQSEVAPLRGFTLIELLMTITIMAAVVALGVNSVSALKTSHSLQASSSELMSQLELARQVARAQNRRVEVRLYADSRVAPAVYRSVRIFLMSLDGKAASPLQRAFHLPATIVISGDNTFSSLLPLCDKSGTDDTGLYRGFSFLPDGTLYPAGAALPTLTLIPEMSKMADPGALPSNFATVQIDPKTGRTKFFKP